MKKYIFLLLVLVFFACKQTSIEVERAFYYWKTDRIDSESKSVLNKLNVKKLYVRYFDISYNEVQGAIPVGEFQGIPCFPSYYKFQKEQRAKKEAEIKNDTTKRAKYKPWYHFKVPDSIKMEIIPTVFITNFTFKKINSQEVIELANKVSKKLNGIISRDVNDEYCPKIIREIQFDCDWTAKTRDNFFLFLTEFKKLNARFKLSATIRLYQYKYFEKAGVPPVDRGMLMFYNLSSLKNAEVKNSILDLKEAKKYLKHKDYPLKLDFALPIFSWGVIFRENRYLDVYRFMDSRLAEKLSFLKKTSENQFVSEADTVYEDFYLREGDKIRVEEISEQQLTESVNMLKKITNSETLTVSFFHLDPKLIEKYDYETFEKVYRAF